MQTYWDGATRQWVTRLPDGTTRPATDAEALLAYSNGAQAPVGSHGPDPTSPIGGAPGTRPAPGGGDPGGTPPRADPRDGTPTLPDPGGRGPSGGLPGPPQSPPPDMSWRTNDQYSVYGRLHGQGSYFQNPDTTQQLFYQTDAGRPVAYASFANQEADPNSYYYRWLQSQQSRIDNGFKDASVADPNLQYTAYLDQASKGLNSQFANLPGWQQGYNATGGFAGRRM